MPRCDVDVCTIRFVEMNAATAAATTAASIAVAVAVAVIAIAITVYREQRSHPFHVRYIFCVLTLFMLSAVLILSGFEYFVSDVPKCSFLTFFGTETKKKHTNGKKEFSCLLLQFATQIVAVCLNHIHFLCFASSFASLSRFQSVFFFFFLEISPQTYFLSLFNLLFASHHIASHRAHYTHHVVERLYSWNIGFQCFCHCANAILGLRATSLKKNSL